MADDAAKQAPPPITLIPNDILGIVQRMLIELHEYCCRPPNAVDPAVCFAYLERTAGFVGRLGPMALPQNGADKGTEKRKAN